MLVVFPDDERHCFVLVRLWLLAHGLLNFLGAAAAGGADRIISFWRHAASVFTTLMAQPGSSSTAAAAHWFPQ